MSDETDPDDLLDSLAEEVSQRLREGESVDLEALADEHPTVADEIRELFPTILEMEAVPEWSIDNTGDQANTSPQLISLGDFRILREIGRGGMGVVYEAEQISLSRHVAVKVLPEQFAQDAKKRQRFIIESKAAARLHHNNIVPVFGVGEEDGKHFYVMQYIRGRSLSEVLMELRESTQESVASDSSVDRCETFLRVMHPQETGESTSGSSSDLRVAPKNEWQLIARIGMDLADALHYAHTLEILHRDIKPANLLLDGAGTVWITDFGLAKLADSNDLTGPGDFVGTLRYSAPELIDGVASEASDQFSLGLTLYELLSLKPAFADNDPKKLIWSVSNCDYIPLREHIPSIPRDLETIVHKSLSSKPSERYSSAQSLSLDLRRFLTGQPIAARPLNSIQKLTRWVQKHPAIATLSASLAIVACAFVVFLVVSRDQLAAETARTKVQYQNTLAAKRKLELQNIETLYLAGQNSEAIAYLARALREEPDSIALSHRMISALSQRRVLLPAAVGSRETDSGETDGGGWDFSTKGSAGRITRDNRYLIHRASEHELRVVGLKERNARLFQLGNKYPSSFEYLPESQQLLIGTENGILELWDIQSGRRERVVFRSNKTGAIRRLSVGPNGNRVSFICRDNEVRVLDLQSGNVLARFRHSSKNIRLSRLISENQLLVVGLNRILEYQVGEPHAIRQHDIDSKINEGMVRYFSSCSRLCFETSGGQLVMFDVNAWSETWQHEKVEKIGDLSMDRFGTKVAVGDFRGNLSILDAADGTYLQRLKHDYQVSACAFSNDGKLVASCTNDSKISLWDVASGQRLVQPLRLSNPVSSLQFDRTDSMLIAMSQRQCQLWLLPGNNPMRMRVTNEEIFSSAIHPTRPLVAASTRDGKTLVWNYEENQIVAEFSRDQGTIVRSVDFSPDGLWLLTNGDDGIAEVIDLSTGRVRHSLQHPGSTWMGRFNPDCKQIATSCNDGTARIWSVESGNLLRKIQLGNTKHRNLQYSPDGELLFASSMKGLRGVWNAQSGDFLYQVPHEVNHLNSRFNSTGSILATAGLGRFARLWDVQTGVQIGKEILHGNWITSMEVHPSKNILATGSLDNTARLWDAETGEPITPPLKHDSSVMDVAFNVDGTLVASASIDGIVKIWDSRTGDIRSLPTICNEKIRLIHFLPTEKRLAIAGVFGMEIVDLNFLDDGAAPSWLPDLAEAIAGMAVSGEGFFEIIPRERLFQIRDRIEKGTSVANPGDAYERWTIDLLSL